MLGLRAYMATNMTNTTISILSTSDCPVVTDLQYNADQLLPVAELVMVSVGYLFLCDSLISLWKRNVEAVIPIDEAPRWVQQLARLLRLLLLAAIATILASSIMSAGMSSDQAPPSESDIQQVTTLRHASYCLSLG
jgi:uncharacterized membrane protein YqjE